MKRKAILSIFLLLVLLISNAGIALQKHYCMGELESIELLGKKDMCCDGLDCHAMMAKGCCEDHIEIIESSDFSYKNFDFTIIPPFDPEPTKIFLFGLLAAETQAEIKLPVITLPISPPGEPLFIEFQSFLI